MDLMVKISSQISNTWSIFINSTWLLPFFPESVCR